MSETTRRCEFCSLPMPRNPKETFAGYSARRCCSKKCAAKLRSGHECISATSVSDAFHKISAALQRWRKISQENNDKAQGAGGSFIAGGSPGATGSAARESEKG